MADGTPKLREKAWSNHEPSPGCSSFMNPEDALRFIHHEAGFCRDRDAHEALCLLLPALLRACDLRPMNGYEAQAFRKRLHDLVKSDFRFDQGSLASCGKR
jgi:hypothetical protein